MLIQNRMITTAKSQIKNIIMRAFSTNQPETSQAPEEKNNDNFPFKFHEDWKAQSEKNIKEQVAALESELSEQQKRRVKIFADAYLELNIHELHYFDAVLSKKSNLEGLLGEDKKSEVEIKHEENMAKLWPMGRRGVSEIFNHLFESASGGGFGGGAAGGGAAGGEPAEVQDAGAAKEASKGAAATQEKAAFEIQLTSFDAAQKIKIIKEVRELLKLGLKEAKEMVEKAPVVLKKDVKKEEAESLKEKLQASGCVITLL